MLDKLNQGRHMIIGKAASLSQVHTLKDYCLILEARLDLLVGEDEQKQMRLILLILAVVQSFIDIE